jgi:hypothetical protein
MTENSLDAGEITAANNRENYSKLYLMKICDEVICIICW